MELVSDIRQHVLVPGVSHDELWLGPTIVGMPASRPQDLHLFFSTTDRRGGDSVQKRLHFVADKAPDIDDEVATWYTSWKERPFPKSLTERMHDGYRFVPTFTWKYHAATGTCLGVGAVLRHQGDALSNHLEHLALVYSVYRPAEQTFSVWTTLPLEVDGKPYPAVAGGQRVDLPDGDVLLPFSVIKKLEGWNSMRWCGSVRCSFDGETLAVVQVSNLVTHPVPRGYVEPSAACCKGRFFMTLRAQDGFGHVTTSSDGLSWDEPQPWAWDDGTPIAMDQTMTKFITHSDGLFLVYTRITEDNGEVFRHRAPLFMAEIDLSSNRLLRDSERVVIPNKGYPVGNFAVYDAGPDETWVTAPEWDRTGREVPCDNRLTRIIWTTPNKHLTSV